MGIKAGNLPISTIDATDYLLITEGEAPKRALYSDIKKDIIGTETLATTSQSIKGAINENASKIATNTASLSDMKNDDAYSTDTGTVNNIIIADITPTAYKIGQRYRIKAKFANTGACTIKVGTLAITPIKKHVSLDLVTGDILANQIITVIFDGTNFQIVPDFSAKFAEITNTALLSASGWFKDKKTGLILQWTSATSTLVASGSSYSATVSFPIAFPTSCLNVTASADGTGAGANGLSCYTANTTSSATAGVFVNNTTSSQTFYIHIFALGY